MFQVVFARFKRRNNLAKGHDCRIAGVVVNIRQAGVDCLLSLVMDHFHPVSFIIESRFE